MIGLRIFFFFCYSHWKVQWQPICSFQANECVQNFLILFGKMFYTTSLLHSKDGVLHRPCWFLCKQCCYYVGFCSQYSNQFYSRWFLDFTRCQGVCQFMSTSVSFLVFLLRSCCYPSTVPRRKAPINCLIKFVVSWVHFVSAFILRSEAGHWVLVSNSSRHHP